VTAPSAAAAKNFKTRSGVGIVTFLNKGLLYEQDVYYAVGKNKDEVTLIENNKELNPYLWATGTATKAGTIRFTLKQNNVAVGSPITYPVAAGQVIDTEQVAAQAAALKSTITPNAATTKLSYTVEYGYDIEFDPNTGTFDSLGDANRIVYGALGPFPAVAKTGHTLAGWYTKLTGGSKVTAKTVPAKAGTYYAHWTPKSYKVTFNVNGGKALSTKDKTKTVKYDLPYGKLILPTRTGYRFDGWFTEKAAGAGIRVLAEDTVALTANQPLYAHWTEAWKVTWNVNGGKLPSGVPSYTMTAKLGTIEDSLNVPTGGPVPATALPVATKTGYTNVSWNTKKDGSGTAAALTTVPDANVTYYAQWAPQIHTVTFNTNAADAEDLGPAATKNVTYNEKFGALPTPVRDGYKFLGWYTKAPKTIGLGKDPSGSLITEKTTVKVTNDTTIYYAKWTGAYKVTLDTQSAGVATGTPAYLMVKKNTAVGKIPSPSWDYHVFIGWRDNFTDEVVKTSTKVKSNVTYDAQWADAYKVIWNANGAGATVTPADQLVIIDAKVGALPTPKRTGYKFGGWYTIAPAGPEGTDPSGTKITQNTVPDPTGSDVTYHAKWVAIQSKITWDANGGAVSPKTTKVTYGEPYATYLPATPAKKGYNFTGWYTKKSGGTKINAADTVSISKDTTLYAHWGKLVVDAGLLESLHSTWGEMKDLLGLTDGDANFDAPKEYHVIDPATGVTYYFDYYFQNDYEPHDDDFCSKISAPLETIVPGVDHPISVAVFTGALKSLKTPATSEIKTGTIPADIAGRYAMVHFGADDGSGGEGSGFGGELDIALPPEAAEVDLVFPSSPTWLWIYAG
jgi:uncharacterized repeat protein (TIGR02543 family)